MRLLIPFILLIICALSCKSPEAREPIARASGSFYKASAERNIKLNKDQEAIFKNMMLTQPDIEFIASETGFWYTYINQVEDDTIRAKFGDVLNFDYSINDINGQVIYTEKELTTQNYPMDQQELFTGLREGLKLMKAGETVTFYFPSNIAYGYYGDKNRIGANIPLICTVTLNSITKNKND